MKKIYLLTAVLSLCSVVGATTINAPSTLVGYQKLDGAKAYGWAVSPGLTAGQKITSATINWNNVTLAVGNSSGTGYLYTDLLSSSSLGVNNVTTYTDNDAPGDYFKTSGSGFTSSTRLGIGSQFFSSVGTTLSLAYTLTTAQLTTLNQFIANSATGVFNVGIDADCHYTVGGLSITYIVGSTSVPSAPDGATTALLIIVGLSAVELFRRKFAAAH